MERERIFCWGFFHRGICHKKVSFQGVNLSREFARILIQNSFYRSCFLFSVSILREERLKVTVRGKFSLGLNYPGDTSMVRGFFCGDGVIFSENILKNDQKYSKTTSLFQLKVRSNIKNLTNRNSSLCEGGCHLKTSLYP